MKKKTIDKTSLKVLYLEDSPRDVEIIRELLTEAGYDLSMDCTEGKKEFTSILHSRTYDVILSDFKLPEFDAFGALKLVMDICPDVPFICVSGSIGEETAIELIKEGAVDYVLKDRMVRLPLAIQRALDEVRERKSRLGAEEDLRKIEQYNKIITEMTTDYVFIVDVDYQHNLKLRWISKNLVQITGRTTSDAVTSDLWKQIIHPEDVGYFFKFIEQILTTTKSGEIECRSITKFGTERWVHVFAKPETDEHNRVITIIGAVKEITERKRSEEALRKSAEQYHITFENTGTATVIIEEDATLSLVNTEFEHLSGYSKDEIEGKKKWTEFVLKEDLEYMITQHKLRRERAEAAKKQYEFRFVDRFGTIHNILLFIDVIKETKKSIASLLDITERKKVEEEFKFSNILLSTQQEVSLDGILVVDESSKILSYNQQFVKMWDIPPEVIETRSDEIVLKVTLKKLENPQRFLEKVNYLYAHKNETSRDEIVLKDGRIFERYSAPMLGADVKYYGRVWNFRDITKRKKAEEALLESMAKYRTLVTQSPDGIFIVDLSGAFLSVNKAMCDNLKYSEEEFLSLKIWDIVPQQYLPLHKNRLAAIIRGESKKDTAEYEVKGKDGIVHFIEVLSAPYYKDKEIIGFQGIARDITERKRAEEAVRQSEEKFRMVFENVFDGICIYSEDPDPYKRRLIECNERYAALAGRSREELLQLGSTQELQKTLEAKANDNRVESLAKGKAYQGSFSWIRPDGKDNIIEFVGVPITWQGKSLSIGIDRDITERKQMEEGLRQMQKLEGLGTLAGGIAHDFNNILGIILAYITSIKRFKGDTKKLELAIDTITKAVDRGKTLVQQILTFARKTETEYGAVNVNDVVMEIMTMVFETFPKILTYTQNFDKSITFINADRSQLYQALLNLCVNARDAMTRGGVLTINTRMVSGASLRNQHPDAAASSYVCIEVSDTGEGMTEEIRKRIFEPFFTTKGIGKGTGLGLSVVFGVVQTHKGFIDVESELGKGTTFRLYLPASQAIESVIEKEEETLEEIPGGTETLLVVEDEETLLLFLQTALVDKGYKVLSAKDGLTALRIYQERKNDISLVLTDLGLPSMTGLEVCQHIKAIDPHEHMILATGFLDPDMKSEFLKAGIQHFLYKPYDFKKVLKVVREVLDEK